MLEFYSDWTIQFIDTLALDVIQVLDVGTIFDLAEVTQFLAWVKPLSLSFGQRVDWLDSLAYTENLTDAYSQYFVNDIEETENKTVSKVQTITWTDSCQLLHDLSLVLW